jgi:UPF0755 protein
MEAVMAAVNASGQRGGAIRSILTLIVVLAVLAILAVGGGAGLAWREATRPGPLQQEAIVLFEPGASATSMANELEKAGAVRYARLFLVAAKFKGHDGALKAGEYAIPAGASVVDIIDLLVEGKSILHYLTAPEGRTTQQILKLVSGHEALTGDLTLAPVEGELLPETYAFTRGQTRDALVSDMMKAQDAVIAELWEGRATELPISTPEEAIILASIVEKETGVAAERPRVAAVFINRLKLRMRLQSDPTVIYGLTGGEPLGRGLRASELERETPYNTYKIFGLPPTPIANPGRAALEAVLNPIETDDLYFVADGTGGHVFAPTLDEHNRNVARWRQIERERSQEG